MYDPLNIHFHVPHTQSCVTMQDIQCLLQFLYKMCSGFFQNFGQERYIGRMGGAKWCKAHVELGTRVFCFDLKHLI